MKIVAAYLLAVLGGNKNPDAAAIGKILSSVGIEANKEQVELFLNELKGKNVYEVIASGAEKLSSVPTGGVSHAPAEEKHDAKKGGEDKKGGAPKEAPKKEEKKPEKPKSEEDEDMGFSLFD